MSQPITWCRRFREDNDPLADVAPNYVLPALRVETETAIEQQPLHYSDARWLRVTGLKTRASLASFWRNVVAAGVVHRDENGGVTTPYATREWEWRAEISERNRKNRLSGSNTTTMATPHTTPITTPHSPRGNRSSLEKHQQKQMGAERAVGRPFDQKNPEQNKKEEQSLKRENEAFCAAPTTLHAFAAHDGETVVSNEDNQKRRNAEVAPSAQLRQALREQVNR